MDTPFPVDSMRPPHAQYAVTSYGCSRRLLVLGVVTGSLENGPVVVELPSTTEPAVIVAVTEGISVPILVERETPLAAG